MTPVLPSTKTTLVLTAGFQPCGFVSARSALRNMIVGAVKAYDHYGNIHDWSSWIGNDDHLQDGHPSLRSVDTSWAVPTIIVVPGYFGTFGKKRTRVINLRQLYYVYGGECQYCLKKIPYTAATRDHVLPRSRGGSNDDSNIVLSCLKCNSKKSNKFPYLNVRGSSVKPKMLNDVEFAALSEKVTIREEWKTFLV